MNISVAMSAQAPSSEKGVNTGLVCQESYACGGSEEALFECDECGSLQCQRCELELHRQDRLKNHERVRIGPGHVPYCDTCKGASGSLGFGHRQRAAIRCQGCKTNLCAVCQKRTHSGVNKRKHPISAYPPSKATEGAAAVDEGEAQKRRLLERVRCFLLVDENEEIQVGGWDK